LIRKGIFKNVATRAYIYINIILLLVFADMIAGITNSRNAITSELA